MASEPSPFRAAANGVRAEIRVRPGAGRNVVDGAATMADGRRVVLVRVSARAEGGKANDAVIGLLARAWGVPKSALSVASGASARRKSLLVSGDPGRLLAALEAWLAATGG